MLLVEDNDDSRWLLELVFTDCGAIVLAVEDAFQAIETFRSNFVSVIVSDIGLPGMNGYDMLKIIRAFERERITVSGTPNYVPAVALSAYTDPESRRRSIEAGFQIHLCKPTNIPTLLAAIGRLLATKPAG